MQYHPLHYDCELPRLKQIYKHVKWKNLINRQTLWNYFTAALNAPLILFKEGGGVAHVEYETRTEQEQMLSWL